MLLVRDSTVVCACGRRSTAMHARPTSSRDTERRPFMEWRSAREGEPGHHRHEHQCATPRPDEHAASPRRVGPRTGTAAARHANGPIPATASSSPLMPSTCGGHVLQRLEHPQEIPLGTNPGGRRRERIGLDAELPGIERRQPGQQRQRERPGEQIAQDEMREGTAPAAPARPVRPRACSTDGGTLMPCRWTSSRCAATSSRSRSPAGSRRESRTAASASRR